MDLSNASFHSSNRLSTGERKYAIDWDCELDDMVASLAKVRHHLLLRRLALMLVGLMMLSDAYLLAD